LRQRIVIDRGITIGKADDSTHTMSVTNLTMHFRQLEARE
jgi:hypothetical protein